jgi:nitrite reductase/ring-hydroxylating ferredoxin subunit
MGFIKRILGICETKRPAEPSCWRYQNGKVEISLSETPELADEGGAVHLEGKGLRGRVLVVHGTDGHFHAFQNRCTHAGRRLDPLPGHDHIRCCSVSRSTFDYAGRKVSGPAKNALTVYEVHVENGKLVIRVERP